MLDPQRDELPYCDLVMKGGITSGVIFPRLIARLATRYRFKSVGGTSAGAIAAAGCAAAEFARLNGRQGSFDELASLPGTLGNPIERPGQPGEPHRTSPGSMLLHLFQPARKLEKHFAVLLDTLNLPNIPTRVASALWSLLREFNPAAWLAPLVMLLVLTPDASAAVIVPWWKALLLTSVLLAAWLGAGGVLLDRRIKAKAKEEPGEKPGNGWLRFALVWWLGGAAVAGVVIASCSPLEWPGPALGVAVLSAINWAVMGALGLLLAIGLSSYRFLATLVRGLRNNLWGLCTGRTTQQKGQAWTEGLTDWLYEYFNDLAGITTAQRPLTFGDLWDGRLMSGDDICSAMAASDDAQRGLPARPVLDLRVMTSAISQQTCFSLPWRDRAPRFYFDPDEWAKLFPDDVMEWLKRHSEMEAVAEDGREEAQATRKGRAWVKEPPVLFGARPLMRLPSSRFLPVIVAVRMSLSFPVLLSAVPLYAIDHTIQKDKAACSKCPKVKRVWFSDGGISSNIPLHFFDELLPSHPTFAINLKEPHPCYPIKSDLDVCHPGNGRVYLTKSNVGGLQRYWEEPAESPGRGLLALVWSMVLTMQNWRDQMQMPYPGYRDRIVQISHLSTEGGLNLDMRAEDIETLGLAGECAAQRLLDAFLDGGANNKGWDAWANHREYRFRTLLGQMAQFVRHPSLHDTSWNDVVPESYEDAGQRAAARLLLDGLRALGNQLGETNEARLVERAPRPHATLKIVPRI